MKRITVLFAILIVLLGKILPITTPVKLPEELFDSASLGECDYCEEEIYWASSKVKITLVKNEVDERPVKLRKYLESRNSPLADYSAFIVQTADRYGVDWRLVPAITGIESAFAILNAAPYNAYGWAGGSMAFSSWEESIEVVTRALRENYINRGADTVGKIAPIYCPPNYIKWTGAVTRYMAQIEDTSAEGKIGSAEIADLTL